MKRRLYVIACICLSLLTVLSSCSLDDLEGNVYERMGMVKFDNPAVNDVSNRLDSMETATVDDALKGQELDLSEVDGFKEIYETIQNIGKQEVEETVELKITLTKDASEVISKNGLLKPQENKDDLYASIGSSLASSSGTKAFVSSMSEPAGEIQSNAAKGTMALTNSLITTLTDNMGKGDGDMPEEVKTILTDLQRELEEKSQKTEDLTKAEVLQVQMITNLVSSVADAADTLKDVEDMSTVMNDSNVMSIMDDLTLLSNVTNTLSGNTDVLDVPNISDLISKFTGSGSES